MLSVTARAPAKLVLSGEYAVLFGAPAVVLAIDRCVVVHIAPRADGRWSLAAPGLADGSDRFDLAAGRVVFDDPDVGARWQLAAAVLNAAGLAVGSGADIVIDSRALYERGRKLGVGSSAAVCVALGRALNAALDAGLDLPTLAALHRTQQGGRGSGVDIAASWHGGLLAVTGGSEGPAVASLPTGTGPAIRIVDTGVAQSTPRMLERLDDWRATDAAADAAIEALCTAARDAATSWREGRGEAATRRYAAALAAFDEASGLGIVSDVHCRLAGIAAAAGVAYKPSGAGGGDIGVAVADDGQRLAGFDRAAEAAGFRSQPVACARAEAA